MLSSGDGIAIAGVCAVMIGAIAKFVRKSNGSGGGYVLKDTCNTNVKAILREIGRLQQQFDDLNKFLRNGRK